MEDYQSEKIDRYFQRAMSPEELRELTTDPELLEELNLRRLAGAALRQADVQAFRRKHSGTVVPLAAVPIAASDDASQNGFSHSVAAPVAASPTATTPVVQMRWRFSSYAWALAASLAILLGALIWWSVTENQQVQQLTALAQKHDFIRPDADWGNIGARAPSHPGGADAAQLKSEGLTAYQRRENEQAISLLEKYRTAVADHDPETEMLALYVGRSWLEMGEFGKAIEVLATAEPYLQGESYLLLLDHVRWQKAQAMLRLGKQEEAKAVLLTLSEGASFEEIRAHSIQLLNELP